ncbi:putative ribosomal protein L18 [Dioscorea sansibarensis]
MCPAACLWSSAAPVSSSSVSLRGTRLIPIPAATSATPLPQSAATFPCIVAKAVTRRQNRDARHQRVRKKVEGTPERPRLCVFRSNKHLYVQVIDDTKMHTIASASTMQKPISQEFDYSSGPTIEAAKKVGEAIAKSCLEEGISKVAFDRGGYPYHGRIEALADSARENGLQF